MFPAYLRGMAFKAGIWRDIVQMWGLRTHQIVQIYLRGKELSAQNLGVRDPEKDQRQTSQFPTRSLMPHGFWYHMSQISQDRHPLLSWIQLFLLDISVNLNSELWTHFYLKMWLQSGNSLQTSAEWNQPTNNTNGHTGRVTVATQNFSW